MRQQSTSEIVLKSQLSYPKFRTTVRENANSTHLLEMVKQVAGTYSVADASFSHRSFHQAKVTKSPHHRCDISCAMVSATSKYLHAVYLLMPFDVLILHAAW